MDNVVCFSQKKTENFTKQVYFCPCLYEWIIEKSSPQNRVI